MEAASPVVLYNFTTFAGAEVFHSPRDQFKIDVLLIKYWIRLFGLEPGSVHFEDKQEEFFALKKALRRVSKCEKEEHKQVVKALLQKISEKVCITQNEQNSASKEITDYKRDFKVLFPFLVKSHLLKPLKDGSENYDEEINSHVQKLMGDWAHIPDYVTIKQKFADLRTKYFRESPKLMMSHLEFVQNVQDYARGNFFLVKEEVTNEKNQELKESHRMISLLAAYQNKSERPKIKVIETLRLVAKQMELAEPFPKKKNPKEVTAISQCLYLGLFFTAIVVGRIFCKNMGLPL